MTTSPGGYGGGNVMKQASTFFPDFGAQIIETFSLPKYYENFDINNGIINPELLKEWSSKVEDFKSKVSE